MSYNNHCLVEPCEWKLHLPSAETIKWSVINQSNLAQLSGKAKTKTMTSATANPTEKANEDSWSAELFPRIEAEPIPKSRTLIADRTPAKKPILWKREGEALTSPGNPLTNLSTIKLSRKKVRKLQAERVWKVCFARFLQSSIYPLDPTHKECTWPVPFQ